jgi:peptide deformylase
MANMISLPLVFAPNKIFKQIAQPVEVVNDDIRKLVDQMFNTMYREKAVGLGANMVGILKRIVVVDLKEENILKPYTFINPEITWSSEETQIFTEASVCFLGIKAEITRPKSIKLTYLDYEGNSKELEASGFFSTVIQHEIDYLNGKVFLDYLSKLKRDTLLKKMEKRTNPTQL